MKRFYHTHLFETVEQYEQAGLLAYGTVKDVKQRGKSIRHRSVVIRFGEKEWTWSGKVDSKHFREFGDMLHCSVPCAELGCRGILYEQSII